MVTIEQLTNFCTSAMSSVGSEQQDAATVADALVMADSWGVFTHGSKLLHDYLLKIQAGGISVKNKPIVDRDGPAWANVQANSVMGHVAGKFAMEVAIEKARQTGVAYVGVQNTNHYGAAGYYAWLAAREGLIGLSMANDIPSVAAPGSRKAVTGSNPLSYGIPCRKDQDPILLDMAISTVAGGKVYAAIQRGESIPDNWIVGPDGLPTTNGSLYPAEASLQPMSGPKGYGIALLVETLSGVLTGAAMTSQVGSWIWGEKSKPTNHGAAFIAIDIQSIMPAGEFERRISHLVDEIHNSPTAEGVDSVMLPGEREWNHRHQALEKGLELPADVMAKLKNVAELIDEHPVWMTD